MLACLLQLLTRILCTTLVLTAISTRYTAAPRGWLAFTRQTETGDYSLHLMDVSSRVLQPLGRLVGASELDWSRDGRLAFRVSGGGIQIFDAHTVTFANPLTGSGRFPAWSPDGRLAFATDDDTFELNIYIFDFDRQALTQVTTDGQGGGFRPAWSPDGRLAYIHQAGFYYDVSIYDPATGTRQRVDHPQDSAANPTWSPDGLLAFQAYGADPTIPSFLTLYDGATTIDLGYASVFEYLSWSADGRLAYVAGFNNDILVYNSRTRQTTNVTQSPLAEGSPRWSPDGHLSFIADGDLYLLDLTTGTRTRLTQSPDIEYFAAWMGEAQ